MQNSQQPHQPAQKNNLQQQTKSNSHNIWLLIIGLAVGVPTVLMGGCVALLMISKSTTNNRTATSTSDTTSSYQSKSTKAYFNAAALAGKNPKEVDKILGAPTDSWTMRSGGQMRSYSLGEDTSVEFSGNRIVSLVIFFNQKDVDSETAYSLVGLDYGKSYPVGIKNITTGEDWIKIYY